MWKSSLLNLLLGYNRHYTGTIQFKGIDMSLISSKQLRNEIMYVTQNLYIFSDTVKENICFGDDVEDIVLFELLKKVGFKEHLSEILYMDATKLSLGQKHRISLARALLRNPKILICDEVTAGLDEPSACEIEQLLLNENNLT